jgi:raffinose/stachyose/melibiose transport system permease protein
VGHDRMIGRRREQATTYAVLGIFSLFAILPIVGIVLTALQQQGGSATFGQFDGIHLDNFKRAWDQGNFGSYLRSSGIVTVSVVAISSALSILSGYAFGLMRFRGSQLLFYVFLLGLMVPMEAMIVPLYYDLRDLQLTDTYWALILPQAGTSIAFGTFWMRAYFRSVPRSLVEAARIDGASSWFTLWRVLLPLARPAVLTMMVLLFMWTWNEFLLALVMVSDEGLRTAPLGLSFFQGRNEADLTLMAAGAVIVALPVVVLYVFLQRHFIRGMLSGAVKG